MKATTTILAAVLTLSINFLFAGNDGAVMNTKTNSIQASLAPSTSAEATIDITTLAPVTPIEADFASDDDTTTVSDLAPVTPSVADFSDGN